MYNTQLPPLSTKNTRMGVTHDNLKKNSTVEDEPRFCVNYLVIGKVSLPFCFLSVVVDDGVVMNCV